MRPLHISRLTATPAPLLLDGRRTAIVRCYLADSFTARLVGLLGTGSLAEDEALFIPRCRSVHAWGLLAPIACFFLGESGELLQRRALSPGGIAYCRGASAVIECRPGVLPESARGSRFWLPNTPFAGE